MGLGDAYTGTYNGNSLTYDEWMKQKQEEELKSLSGNTDITKSMDAQSDQATGLATADGMEADSKAQDTVVGAIEGVASKYPGIGTVVAGVLGAANEGVKSHKPGETANLEKGMEEGIKHYATSAIAGEAGKAMGPTTDALSSSVTDTANETFAEGGNSLLSNSNSNTLGDAYKTSLADGMELKVDPSLTETPSISNGINPTMTTGTQTGFMDRASNFATDYVRGATKGLIGGDYTPREGTGSFGNDFFNGVEKGGGIDRAVGNLRGGNYGETLGQAAKYTIDNYKKPHYNADDYKNKFTINYNTGY